MEFAAGMLQETTAANLYGSKMFLTVLSCHVETYNRSKWKRSSYWDLNHLYERQNLRTTNGVSRSSSFPSQVCSVPFKVPANQLTLS